MPNIILNNDDFNLILSKSKKVDINKFVEWYESLCPSYKFIKDKKKIFQKNSKNIYIAIGLNSVLIGEDISWENLFFLKHFNFLNELVTVLNNKGVNYWENYLNHILSLSSLPLSNMYDVICYAVEDKSFVFKNKNKLKIMIEKSINLLSFPKNTEYIEKYLDIFKYIIANETFEIEWSVIQLSKLVDSLPQYKFQYQLKDIFNTQKVLDLNISENKVSKLILPYIKKKKSYSSVTGTGYHFSINTFLFTLDFKHGDDSKISHSQLNYQLNVLSNFINSISDDKKIFWFIESRFNSNNSFDVNAFPKDNESLFLLQSMIDECVDKVYEERELEIFLNKNYLEFITPITQKQGKQGINKF